MKHSLITKALKLAEVFIANELETRKAQAEADQLPAVKRAIDTVIGYNWNDELDHYCENEQCRPSHIFKSLVVLDNFISGRNVTPESYL